MKGKKRTRVNLLSHDPQVAAVHQILSPAGEHFPGDEVDGGSKRERERVFCPI